VKAYSYVQYNAPTRAWSPYKVGSLNFISKITLGVHNALIFARGQFSRNRSQTEARLF